MAVLIQNLPRSHAEIEPTLAVDASRRASSASLASLEDSTSRVSSILQYDGDRVESGEGFEDEQ